MKVTKLAVGIVTAGQMDARTACSLISALPHIAVPFQMLLSIGCYIHWNRNNLIKMALKDNFSHVFFCDTDMFFGPDAIRRLMDADKDIIGARYNKHVLPIESTVPNITELSKVPFVPTGFLLINLDVFRKGGEPYFSMDGCESEDLYFCSKAIANGYDVWCDPTIEIGHIGTSVY